MTLFGITIFGRMHCGGKPTDDVIIAAWHPPRSITWRWSLTRAPFKPYNDSFYYTTNNGGAAAGCRLPFIGNVHFQSQAFMLDPDKPDRRKLDRIPTGPV